MEFYFVTFGFHCRLGYKLIQVKAALIMYRSNKNWEVIQLLLRLRAIENEYPHTLFFVRRNSFLGRILRLVL